MAKSGKRHKIRLKENLNELSKPKQLIERNLLAKSVSNTFDEAKEEWIIDSAIDSTCDGFSGSCQLCHAPGLKWNFILINPDTGCTMKVGSTCIVRFGVGRGVISVESGYTLLQNILDEQHYTNKIQTNVKNMMVIEPDARELNNFVSNLKQLMELRGIANPTDQQLGLLFFGSSWEKQDIFKLKRMRMLWDRPGLIDTKRSKKVVKTSNPKEGSTWYKKRTRAATSLSSSEIYDVERYIVESENRKEY